MITISTHTGHTVSQLHNIREENHTAQDGHIDPSKSHLNEIIRHEPIQDAYHRLFDEAVKEYNAKQKRNDRKIDNYYQKIKKSKQQYVAYEMCAGVYNKTGDNGVVDEGRREFDDELGKTIMMEYALGFPERNPNLEVVGIYYHADEVGQPAMHITYIPVAYDCKRGLSTQTGLDKALQQQSEAFRKKEAVYEYERNEDGSYKLDDKGKKIKKLGDDGKPIQISEWTTPQILWEARENQILEAICNKYGLSVEHPDRDAGGRRHQQTAAYKKSKDEQRALEKEIAQQREAAEQERQQHEDNLLRIAADAEAAETKKAKAEKAAAEQSERLAQERADADREAKERTARLAREAQEAEANLRRIADDAEAAEAKKAKAEKAAADKAKEKKENEDFIEFQKNYIDNLHETIEENQKILQKTDEKGLIAENRWLYSVIDAVESVFPVITPILNKIFDLKGKKTPKDIAKAWDIKKQDLVEERDTGGKDDGNER